MRRTTSRMLVIALAGTAVLFGVVAATDSGAATGPAPAEDPPAVVEPVLLEVEDPERLVRDLDALAAAWADGGGTFGYPFWEKAGQRWRTGQLTTTMYREYVTGYRDRLEAGCELVDSVETGTEVSDEVRSLALGACRERVDALRAQQQWLDAEVEQAVRPEPDAATLEAVRARAAEHQAEYVRLLQSSLRDVRIAMELAQGALVQEGRDRLREDAFV